jgi:hypothetical protein
MLDYSFTAPSVGNATFFFSRRYCRIDALAFLEEKVRAREGPEADCTDCLKLLKVIDEMLEEPVFDMPINEVEERIKEFTSVAFNKDLNWEAYEKRLLSYVKQIKIIPGLNKLYHSGSLNPALGKRWVEMFFKPAFEALPISVREDFESQSLNRNLEDLKGYVQNLFQARLTSDAYFREGVYFGEGSVGRIVKTGQVISVYTIVECLGFETFKRFELSYSSDDPFQWPIGLEPMTVLENIREPARLYCTDEAKLDLAISIITSICKNVDT